MENKFLIFDIFGDYAHFKKYYTTSSPLTFSIPPRTAIIGLISAIIGIDKNQYLEVMSKTKARVAVRIINPIQKVRMGINLINTKDWYWWPVRTKTHEPRTQIRFEFLRNPRFRIYFSHSELYNNLKEFLQNHKSFYTPYLGISELICDFEFIEESEIEEELEGEDFIDVHTVVPLEEKFDLEIEEGKSYYKEKIPTEMEPGRAVKEYREVIYEEKGKTIKCKIKGAYRLKNGDVITLL
ncbi:MAG: type I-B CRISPR-associated protein Cas5b [candidate division WOR-3 bacterium]|nr:type I-B CRISPR-associated protein Cas5b [Candidatus Omnitrophota bacterium]